MRKKFGGELRCLAACLLAGDSRRYIMEVLRENVLARGGSPFKALLVNFKKLRADPPPSPDAISAAEEQGEEVYSVMPSGKNKCV